MANLPFADIAPVAIAIEAIHAGRRRGDLKITGIDLDSGDRMTVKVKSHGPWSPRPAALCSDGLVLVLSLEHALKSR
ncbi:hypothetical protein [Brevundimonas diminuta]|uniref:hypothetical protein n=1 Tax=Brevundimonas diminuta TaxID=293 RepID=UPI0006280424|nr:hypothetical protein [Brevundimonas diminuta]